MSSCGSSDHCELISDGSAIPVVSFRLAKDRGYTEFDVSHELRGYGWQVPAYTMPDNATDVSVLRIVVREGLSADLARALHDDARTALASLDKLKPGGHYDQPQHFAPLELPRTRRSAARPLLATNCRRTRPAQRRVGRHGIATAVDAD